MTILFRILVLVLVATLVPTVSPAADKKSGCRLTADAKPDKNDIAKIDFRAIDAKGRPRGGDSFGLDTKLVMIQTEWPHLTEPHNQVTQVHAPDGNLFRTYTTAFDPTRPNKPDVELVFPVSGSWVQQMHLTGTWCVVVYLDNHPEPVAERGFVINLK
jgi:hypothetical protein